MEKVMWERAVTGLAAKLLKPNSGVIDVGANIGGVSHALAQMVPEGKVIAIEANRKLIRKIKQRIADFDLKNVKVIHRAAYKDNFRLLTLNTDESLYASSSSLYRVEGNLKKQRVRTLKLDSLRIKNLDLIKIDVEGAEVDVLKGAYKIIHKINPWIIFEVEVPIRSREENPIELLETNSYNFLDVNSLERVDYEKLMQNPGVFNILAVPNNRFLEVKKELIGTLGLQESIIVTSGSYLFQISLSGAPECVQGIGLWNLKDSNWEIYFETQIAHLKHSTNSCLPLYLSEDTEVEIRFGLTCTHSHFISSRVFNVTFNIS